MFKKEDLDSIYIRVKIDDKWQNLSLQEIHDKEHGPDIVSWFLKKSINISLGEKVTTKHILKMVNSLRKLGFPIHIYKVIDWQKVLE